MMNARLARIKKEKSPAVPGTFCRFADMSGLGILIVGMLDAADAADRGNDADNHREDGDEKHGGDGDDYSCFHS
jgi:hypothetical protein